jgi:hypothetical protein
MKLLSIVILAALAAASPMRGQSPAPVVVQAVSPAQPATTAAVPAPASAASASVLKVLQEMKAANDEVLKKQAATLQQLDEMQKSAEQIKVYTKRG